MQLFGFSIFFIYFFAKNGEAQKKMNKEGQMNGANATNAQQRDRFEIKKIIFNMPT